MTTNGEILIETQADHGTVTHFVMQSCVEEECHDIDADMSPNDREARLEHFQAIAERVCRLECRGMVAGLKFNLCGMSNAAKIASKDIRGEKKLPSEAGAFLSSIDVEVSTV